MERYLRHYYYKMEDHAMVLQIGLNIDELSIPKIMRKNVMPIEPLWRCRFIKYVNMKKRYIC